MLDRVKRTLAVLGVGVLLALFAKRFFHINYEEARGGQPKEQRINDSYQNTFEGTFQPAFFNINVNVNNH